MRRFFLFTALLFGLVSNGVRLLAQEAKPPLAIEKLMTPEELRVTGVGSLTSAQRAALNKWLSEYTSLVFQLVRKATSDGGARRGSSEAYAGVGSGHWIQDNASDGAIITLEDGSMWQINPVDQVDTALWLATTDITVLKRRSPVGDFTYELVNTEDNEKALAKYLGR